jgi:hypothetical protein
MTAQWHYAIVVKTDFEKLKIASIFESSYPNF